MKRPNKGGFKKILRLIALRRLKASRETVPLALGMLFSLLLLSFFGFFTVTVQGELAALANGLPHVAFVRRVADYLRVAAGLLAVATFLTVRTWAKLSSEASGKTAAILNSLGATSAQRRYVRRVELTAQYGAALLVGTTAGAVGGIAVAQNFLENTVDVREKLPIYVILWITVLTASAGVTALCYTLPQISLRRFAPTATERLRRGGQAVSAEAHGYRSSQTFKRQSLLKRLAAKSVDFYKIRYQSLATSLAVSVFYPLLAGLLIFHLLGETVVADTNPYDGIDTAAAVADSIRGLLGMIAVGFLLLTAQGVWSAILLIRAQIAHRKQVGRAYLAMGMTEREFRRVMLLELRVVLLRGSICLLLLFLIANFLFLRII